MLFALLLSIVLVPASSGAPASESGKTPLQSRAEAAMKGFDQLRTEAEKRERQGLLLAMADTLEAAGEDVLASHCLERAGIFSYQFAEYEDARGIWDRGLAVARRSGDDRRVAALLNASAIGVSISGDDARAAELQRELILKRQEIGDPRGEGVSWYNLAYSYEALFRIPEAIEAFRRALRLNQETGNAYGAALCRSALANHLFNIGQIEEAMALADSAVVDAERQEAPFLAASALGNRGLKRYLLGRFARALEDYELARSIAAETGASRVQATNAVNEARVLAALGRGADALALLDAVEPDLAGEENRPARVAWAAARGRALAVAGRTDEARGVLRQALEELARFREDIDSDLGRAEAFRIAGAAWTDLAALEEVPVAWRLVEEGSAALLREQLGLAPVALTEFQELLRETGATAVQFSAPTPEYVVACVITPDGLARHVIGLPEDFALEIATGLRLLASAGAADRPGPVLERIAAVLLAPLDLEGERLVVFPGGFTGMPFEALPVGGGELGAGRALTYAPSATAFAHLQRKSVAEGPVLVFADPALPAPDAPGPFDRIVALRRPLTALPQAREEARHIAPGVARVLEGEGATRESFFGACEGSRVIHFATHAVVDPAHPDHSAILLAAGEPLDADSIDDLRIEADLVSLSGCSTADGYLLAGEGTLGLTRAFLVAGTRSVVASWWDVDDAAARRFMELFYAELRSGADRDRALQAAREEMADEGFPARDRLAFALVGATAAPVPSLQVESSLPRLRLLMAFAGALLLVFWFSRARQN